jgi:hypothetical protein
MMPKFEALNVLQHRNKPAPDQLGIPFCIFMMSSLSLSICADLDSVVQQFIIRHGPAADLSLRNMHQFGEPKRPHCAARNYS